MRNSIPAFFPFFPAFVLLFLRDENEKHGFFSRKNSRSSGLCTLRGVCPKAASGGFPDRSRLLRPPQYGHRHARPGRPDGRQEISTPYPVQLFHIHLLSPFQSPKSLSVCPAAGSLRGRNGRSDRVRTCISAGYLPYRLFPLSFSPLSYPCRCQRTRRRRKTTTRRRLHRLYRLSAPAQAAPGRLQPGEYPVPQRSRWEIPLRFGGHQSVSLRESSHVALHALVHTALRCPPFTTGRPYPPVLRRSSLEPETRLEVFPVLPPFALPERTYKIQVQIPVGTIALTLSETLGLPHRKPRG